MDEASMPYREIRSDNFVVSREALDEAYSALAGCRHAFGDVANISVAMEKLKTAQGQLHGETYNGHEPNFVVGGSSEAPPPGTF